MNKEKKVLKWDKKAKERIKNTIYNIINMVKKGFFDRLESKQFTKNLISLFGVILIGIIIIILIIMKTIDANMISNIIYWVIGLVSGLLGGKAIQNDKN